MSQENGQSNPAMNENGQHQTGMNPNMGQNADPRDRQEQQFDSGTDQPWGSAAADSDLMSQVREHMDVIGPDGQQLGRVDSIEGDRIKLTRQDSPDGQHHYVSVEQVEGIENGQLRLSSIDHDSSPNSLADEPTNQFASTDSVNTGSGYASGK